MPQYNMTNYNKAVTGKVRSINGTIIPYKPLTIEPKSKYKTY